MIDLVVHSESGLMLDFAEDDFGGSEQAAVIEAWSERGHRVKFRGEFTCYRHRNHEQPWLYLQQRGDLLVAAHWPGSELDGTHEIYHRGVSDEHKRQVEYVQRAGETAGFEVRTEVRLPTKVIPDAVIYGPHQIGIEVQRSALTAGAAKARTTKARRAGIESLWLSDNRQDPAWLWQVPGVRMMDLPWDKTPPPGFVKVVSGVRLLVPRRCRNMRNSSCPDRRYGCNRWHPDHDPYSVLVDDLAAAVPEGKVVPILWRPFKGRGRVLLVRAHDKMRYEEMLGESADLPLRDSQQRIDRRPARVECVADAGTLLTPAASNPAPRDAWVAPDGSGQVLRPAAQPLAAELEPAKASAPNYDPVRCDRDGAFLIQLVPGKFYCPTCHQREMNNRGLANYPLSREPEHSATIAETSQALGSLDAAYDLLDQDRSKEVP